MVCLTCLRWFDVYVVWVWSCFYTTIGASEVRRWRKAALSDAVARLARCKKEKVNRAQTPPLRLRLGRMRSHARCQIVVVSVTLLCDCGICKHAYFIVLGRSASKQ